MHPPRPDDTDRTGHPPRPGGTDRARTRRQRLTGAVAGQVSKIAVGSMAVTTMLGTSGSSLMRRSTATLQIA